MSQPDTERATQSIVASAANTNNQPLPQRTWRELLPDYVRAVAALCVPIVVAVFGGIIQKQMHDADARRHDVAMAVSILSSSDVKDQDLRRWAIALIDRHSSIPLTDPLKDLLTRGQIVLPKGFGRHEATGQFEHVPLQTPFVIERSTDSESLLFRPLAPGESFLQPEPEKEEE